MPRIKMYVVPEPMPGTATVFENAKAPGFTGQGDVDYLCGSCGVVLLKGLWQEGQVRGIVHICPICGAYNQVERPAKEEPIH